MSIDRRLIALGMAATIAAAALALLAIDRLRAPAPNPPPALRLAIPPPLDLSVGGGHDYPFGLAIAPDGRRVVFPAVRGGMVQLWLRDLSTGDTQPLPGTAHGVLPFWAPDGRTIGFFADGRLRGLTLENAAVHDLGEAVAPRGAAWHANGDIVFGREASGPLVRRVASDGRIEPFTQLDSAAGELSHRFPLFVNGGRDVVFFVRGDSSRQGIWLASAPNPGERRRLVSSDANAVAVGDAIVYREGDVLVGQRLDPGMRALTGRPMLVGSGVGAGPQHQLFAAAHDDLLIYGTPSSSLRELRWHDRGGTVVGGVGEPMDAWDVRIAPSGSAVAVTRVDPQLGTLDIWTYEGSRPIPRRISPAIDADDAPAWSRDGQRLAWVSARRSLVLRAALAAAPEETIRKFEHPARVTDWSPDAQWLVVSESRPVTQSDLWLVPASAQGEPLVYANTAFNEVQGVVSPDGRWIAYASDESGRYEIYLDTLPTPATRARLTNGGGQDPRWRADGGEIFFRRGSEVHAVTPFAADGRPEAMSSTRLFDAGADIRAYDVAADGQRFLLNLPTPDAAPRPLMAIVNIRTLLRFAP